jgi:hypothetical protein
MFRQGDVLLVPIPDTELPQDEVPLAGDTRGRLVLALGEASGHAHAVAAPDADLVADAADFNRLFLRIVTEAVLSHEEHDPVPLPPGLYQVVRQREYVLGARFRSVED